MKNDYSFSKTIKWSLLLLLLVLLVIRIWTILLWDIPKDVLKENITIDAAQNLVDFQICTPTYIPAILESNPKITYVSEEPYLRETTDIRMFYQSLVDKKKALGVYQRYTPDDEVNSSPNSDGAKVNLLYWITPNLKISDKSTNSVLANIQIKASIIQTNQIAWWLYEIDDPSEYRSTMTTWIRNHVEYRILSLLSADEIKKITQSMFECPTTKD